MDEIARYNTERWEGLARAGALFTRPALDLTPETARQRVDPEGLFGELAGQDVLCLAGGGGQQSAAFALLGANVSVFDISETQLKRDREAAAHYGSMISTVQGDMRDLSALGPAAFDLVFQPYSLGFVPDCREVFAQAARVLRPGGLYYVAVGNPFALGLTEQDWNGEGYTLRRPYTEKSALSVPDAEWVYPSDAARDRAPHRESREYRHTLAALLNGPLELGFSLVSASDTRDLDPEPDAEPGTWGHRAAFAPPWLAFWWRYAPASATE